MLSGITKDLDDGTSAYKISEEELFQRRLQEAFLEIARREKREKIESIMVPVFFIVLYLLGKWLYLVVGILLFFVILRMVLYLCQTAKKL